MSHNPENEEYTRSLSDIRVHVVTQHVFGFLGVIGLIRLSATCRKWYAVRRSILETTLSAERAAGHIEFAGSPDFSPHRAHRYSFWLTVCPRPRVEVIVERYGKKYPTDVLEAMVMFERKKTWPWLDDHHALVVRDVMFWCGVSEIEKIRYLLDARMLAYTDLGLLAEPYNDVYFANRVVSTTAEWTAFKVEWLAVMGEARVRLFDHTPPLHPPRGGARGRGGGRGRGFPF